MVVPPFGFGIGDFLAVAKLTGKIALESKDVSVSIPEILARPSVLLCTADSPQNGEAASKYQNLIIELESLERALSRLYTLKPAEHELAHLEAIRAAATACKRPLESFLAKVEKFDKRLGTQNAKDNQFKGAGRRIQFNVAFEEDVKELRTTLASHVLTINTLLMTQMLGSGTVAETDRGKNIESLKILYEAHNTLLEKAGRKQDKMFADSSAHRKDLTALQEKLDQLHHEGAGASIKLDEQQKILEAIEQKIESVKSKLDTSQTYPTVYTPDEIESSSSFATALSVTYQIATLVLSGTMIASACALAQQAKNLSWVARSFEIQVPPAKKSIDQSLPMKCTGPIQKAQEQINIKSPAVHHGCTPTKVREIPEALRIKHDAPGGCFPNEPRLLEASVDPSVESQSSSGLGTKTVAIEASKEHQCWRHGCNGRHFSTSHRLLSHQEDRIETRRKKESIGNRHQGSSTYEMSSRQKLRRRAAQSQDPSPWDTVWDSLQTSPVDRQATTSETKHNDRDSFDSPHYVPQPCAFPGCKYVAYSSIDLRCRTKEHHAKPPSRVSKLENTSPTQRPRLAPTLMPLPLMLTIPETTIIHKPDSRADRDRKKTAITLKRLRKFPDGKKVMKKSTLGSFDCDIHVVGARYDEKRQSWMYTLTDREQKEISGEMEEQWLG